MSGASLSNERTVYERMLCSLLRVLNTAEDGYQDIRQFLACIFDAQISVLHSFDEFCDQYWRYRMMSLHELLRVIKELKADLEGWTMLNAEDC